MLVFEANVQHDHKSGGVGKVNDAQCLSWASDISEIWCARSQAPHTCNGHRRMLRNSSTGESGSEIDEGSQSETRNIAESCQAAEGISQRSRQV